jgi:hypothetical protein
MVGNHPADVVPVYLSNPATILISAGLTGRALQDSATRFAAVVPEIGVRGRPQYGRMPPFGSPSISRLTAGRLHDASLMPDQDIPSVAFRPDAVRGRETSAKSSESSPEPLAMSHHARTWPLRAGWPIYIKAETSLGRRMLGQSSSAATWIDSLTGPRAL